MKLNILHHLRSEEWGTLIEGIAVFGGDTVHAHMGTSDKPCLARLQLFTFCNRFMMDHYVQITFKDIIVQTFHSKDSLCPF